MCEFVHLSTSACRVQKVQSDSMELGLQVVMSYPMWVLGSSARILLGPLQEQ